MNFRKIIRSILPADLSFFRRFWLAIVFFAAAAIASLMDGNSDLQLVFVFSSVTGGVISAEVSLFGKNRDWSRIRRILLSGSGALFTAGFFSYLYDMPAQVYTIRFILTLIACAAFLPIIFSRASGICVRESVISLVRRALTSGFFALLVFAGLSLAALGVTTLFEIRISGIVYIKTWFVCSLFLAPTLFLATLPEAGDNDRPDPENRILSVLVLYILLPLTVLYLLISYAYIIKILIEWRMPRGVAGILSLGFSLIAVSFRILFQPYQDRTPFLRRLYRFLPYSVLPLLLLLSLAIGMRIGEYGITEGRYLVIAAGVWLFLSAIWMMWKKNENQRFLFLTLGIIALFSLAGPWNVQAVARRSQMNRLVSGLKRAGYVHEGRLVKRKGAKGHPDDLDVFSVARYLQQRGWLSGLTNHIRMDFTPTARALYFFLQDGKPPASAARECTVYRQKEMVVRTTGFDWTSRFDVNWHTGRILTANFPGDIVLQFNREKNSLRLYRNDRVVLTGNLLLYLRRYYNKLGNRASMNFKPGENRLIFRSGRYRVMLVLEKLTFSVSGEPGKRQIKDTGFRSRAFIGL